MITAAGRTARPVNRQRFAIASQTLLQGRRNLDRTRLRIDLSKAAVIGTRTSDQPSKKARGRWKQLTEQRLCKERIESSFRDVDKNRILAGRETDSSVAIHFGEPTQFS